ncbi:MAG: sulfurtransferase TusA family protein [Desulfatiglandaceae bacterium]
MKTHPDAILDLRGSFIPVAMLEFSKAFNDMTAGGIMEILVGDQETENNLFKVLRAYPHELVNVQESDSLYRVRLRKGRKKVVVATTDNHQK